MIGLSANLGFAGGCNVGIRYALDHGADLVLLLNNDVVAPPNLIDELVDAAVTDPSIGILTPNVLRPEQKQKLTWLGGYRLPFTLWFVGVNVRDEMRRAADPIPLDFVFGLCILIKREVFEHIGLLDERFFMYFEDVDFCLRARDNGFKVAYLPQAVVTHLGGGSTRHRPGLGRFLLGRSRQLFFRHHIRGWWWVVFGLYELFFTMRFTLILMMQGEIDAALLYIGGTLAGIVAPSRGA